MEEKLTAIDNYQGKFVQELTANGSYSTDI